MNKKTIIIISVSIVVIIINLIFIAYLFDSNAISVNADTESDFGVSDLQKMPSPDNSIINRFFSKILEPFY